MAKNRYNNYSKEQLLEKIKQLEKHRYGLMWENKQEEVAEQCDQELPVLHEDTSREIKSKAGLPQNILIEGDNYHALYTLNFTHKRKVDVIYIDPPYNTGNKSWRYNNNYVDKEDRYRHSKFLSFISKRLRLAKQLLKDSGILICAIDDYEVAAVKLLLDDIFNELNRLGTLVVVHNPRGRNDDKFFASQHEYLLIYAKNSDKAHVGHFTLTEEDKDQYKQFDDISAFSKTSFIRTGNNSKRTERPNLYYPIYYHEKKNKLSLEKHDGWEKLLPLNTNGEEKTWRWEKKTFSELHETELFVKRVKGENKIFKKRRLRETTGKKPKTVWYNPKYDASSNGIMLLQKILGRENTFNYPKSLYAVRDILELTTNKNSLVVDFFAGSGTTGHAILELNDKDGGKRHFILCTNNEVGEAKEIEFKNKYNIGAKEFTDWKKEKRKEWKEWCDLYGICSSVTYPRIKKVIKGYNGNKSIFANLKYFKTEFVPQILTDNDKRVLVSRSTELLCLAENTFELIRQSKRKMEYAIYLNPKQLTAIIYDEDAIEKCKKELEALKPKDKTVIYVFSYDHEYNVEDFEDLTISFTVKPIPEAILNVYRKNAKLRRK
ncbi:site-specific DNA-methyltransferase [bacterium]|nr:site-specific DNA-methyltransferase [bacterium]